MLDDDQVKRYRGYLRTIANAADDPDGFAQAVELLELLEAQLCHQLDRLRRGEHVRGDGYSWAELAAPSGLTRQGFSQRWQRAARHHEGMLWALRLTQGGHQRPQAGAGDTETH